MKDQAPTPRPRPCGFCGYDLRGTLGPACPECGGIIPCATASTGRGEHDTRHTHADALTEFRTATRGTIVLWLGCIFVPGLGAVACVILAIWSVWRALGCWRAKESGLLDTMQDPPYLRLLPQMVVAEVAVAALGALATISLSFLSFSTIPTVILVIVRAVWICLVAVNSFLITEIALRSMLLSQCPPYPWVIRRFTWLILAAPIGLIPFMFTPILEQFVNNPVIEIWRVGASLLAVIACVVGLAGIAFTQHALTQAAEGLVRVHKRESIRVQKPFPLPKRTRVPDAPPKPGKGDVIPFEDDPQ